MLVAKPDRDDYLYLAGGLVLVACCAAAVKFVFNLRMRYWVVLLLVLAAIAILMFGYPGEGLSGVSTGACLPPRAIPIQPA